MESIHGSCPDAELVLVTTTLPNALLGTPPIHFWDSPDAFIMVYTRMEEENTYPSGLAGSYCPGNDR